MFECKKCGKLLGSKALHALHFHERHDGPATKAVLNVLRLRARPAKNYIPTSVKEAKILDLSTRSPRSRSVRTLPGGRSKNKLR